MDPDVTWCNLTLHQAQRDRAAIAEDADALIGWLEKEGYLPGPLKHMGRRGALLMLRTVRAVAEME